MPRRHPAPSAAWMLTDERMGDALWRALRRLPRGGGVIVRHHSLPHRERQQLLRRIRRLAAARGLLVLDDRKQRIARVHNLRELRNALLRDSDLLFISPLFGTRSHPGLRPLSPMQAATLARLSPRPVHAMGGMNARRFRQVRPQGFSGYGAIDAWIRT